MWSTSDNDYHFDSGNEWLVTNLTQELSAGLEDSTLLTDSIFDCDGVKQERLNGDYESSYSCNFINECINREISDEIEIYDEAVKREQSSSSGSEASSLEQCWTAQGELDTPPTTPPNLGLPPERICVISRNDVTFLPIPVNGLSAAKVGGGRPKAKVKTIAAKASELTKHGDVQYEDVGPASLARSQMSKEDIHKQQARRRQERMIRNRESAYLSRKRAKEHVGLLERQVQTLAEENSKLKEENAELRERLSKHEPVPRKQPWRRIPELPKKTTALLAIAVTVCINLHPFTLFEDGVTGSNDINLAPAPTNHHTRSLLWVGPLDDTAYTNLSTSCPVAINQSESMRLEKELRQWIVGGEKGAATSAPPRLFTLGPQRNSSGRKKRIPRARRPRAFPLDVWGLKPSLLGLEGLYEAIHRRPDTFYLVSFSADHLLLPAMARNETSRPKMSVMLPAFLANASAAGGGQVEMMQIDCEVTNTQLLRVRDDDIPSHLRHAPHPANDTVKTVDPKGIPTYSLAEDPSNFVMNLSRKRQSGNTAVQMPAFIGPHSEHNNSQNSESKERDVVSNATDSITSHQDSHLLSQTGAILQKPKDFTSRLNELFPSKTPVILLRQNASDGHSADEWRTSHPAFRPMGH